jgi:hypothetical protein
MAFGAAAAEVGVCGGIQMQGHYSSCLALAPASRVSEMYWILMGPFSLLFCRFDQSFNSQSTRWEPKVVKGSKAEFRALGLIHELLQHDGSRKYSNVC